MEIKRGVVYFVRRNNDKALEKSSVQNSGRPWLVVSNNVCNKFSSVITAVPFTTRDKPALPTHVAMKLAGVTSTALCEQIKSLPREVFEQVYCQVSSTEMRAVERAILVQIGVSSVSEVEEMTSAKNRWTESAKLAFLRDYYSLSVDALCEKYGVSKQSIPVYRNKFEKECPCNE